MAIILLGDMFRGVEKIIEPQEQTNAKRSKATLSVSL
jgi:hypothetical protein